MALVMSRSGKELTNMLALGAWTLHALNVAAIYRLRRLRPKMRGLPRLSASPSRSFSPRLGSANIFVSHRDGFR